MPLDMRDLINTVERQWIAGQAPSAAVVQQLAGDTSLQMLMPAAERLALHGFGRRTSYSRKVFIPLTQLCRDVCGYCTFAGPPQRGAPAYLTLDQVLEIARAGVRAGCQEALFTLGDKPELRFASARRDLAQLGHDTTLDYLRSAAQAVFQETGLLPHLNPGVMSGSDLQALRPVAASMGLMLESTSRRLLARGAAHWKAPDKDPQLRLATLVAAGEQQIAMTTGLLIGIGESRAERIDALLAIRAVHAQHGNIQEVIIQNFRAKTGTRMHAWPDAQHEELLWTLAVARLVLGPAMSLQVPPNLSPGRLASLVAAGANDWGGVSPVTPDHVNPEAPWPHLERLAAETSAAGRTLTERLALGPDFVRRVDQWCAPEMATAVRRRADALGFAQTDAWRAGADRPPPASIAAAVRAGPSIDAGVRQILKRIESGADPRASDVAALFAVEGPEFDTVIHAADRLRAQVIGEAVTYVVNRNINYTNVCVHRCGFCAFAKGRSAKSLRGPAYDLPREEIAARTCEAAQQGATEVCLQGGIHPAYTGDTYLAIARAVKAAVPGMHLHAFSPLEIWGGARSLNLPLREYLLRLKEIGLASLPGTAAEILDDEIRAIICPDKITTAQWFEVMETAHAVGLRSTATIMFGHVEEPIHWARHLLGIRSLQQKTGGFTEFVPLPFVHMESPLWRRGRARSGPSFREALLMHAVARLVLHPHIANIQTSWVKMGVEGALLALQAGANDLGGTLLNESITRAAGGVHGQIQDADTLAAAIRRIGRVPRQRTTLYRSPVAAPVNTGTKIIATA
jgi:FO synthase